MTRKYHIHRPHTNPQHREEETQDINIITMAITQSKATSSLFLSEIIAKLERTQGSTLQIKNQTQPPKTMGVTTNNEPTTTNPPPYNIILFILHCLKYGYTQLAAHGKCCSNENCTVSFFFICVKKYIYLLVDIAEKLLSGCQVR